MESSLSTSATHDFQANTPLTSFMSLDAHPLVRVDAVLDGMTPLPIDEREEDDDMCVGYTVESWHQ